MRVHRQQRAATALVILAVLLGPLWVGVLGASGADNPADRLIASRPLLLGMLLAALAAAFRRPAWRPGSDPVRVGSLAWCTQREARAPPSLQPA